MRDAPYRLLAIPPLLGYWLARRVLTPHGAAQQPPLKWEEVHRILVIRTDSIGDVVLFSSFLRGLKQAAPRAGITLVVNPAVADLVRPSPFLDEVIEFDTKVGRYLRPVVLPVRALLLALRQLRARRFQVALAPKWCADAYYSGLLAAFSGAPTRIAFSERITERKRRMNRGHDRLYTSVFGGGESTRHEVQRNLDFLYALGVAPLSDARLEVSLTNADEASAGRLLAGIPAGAGSVIALGIGAGAPHREWPLDRFVALARWLVVERGAHVVLVGGHSEARAAQALADAVAPGVLNLSGRTSLRETAAVLRRCSLFVGNDSGPMHLAAASGLPVVEISSFPITGPADHWNSPARFGPWGVPARILRPAPVAGECANGCVAGRAHCIVRVSLTEVQAAVEALLPVAPALALAQ